MTRRQLTDAEWGLIEPYVTIGAFGPYPARLREQFEGVIWRFRSGAPWREMPREFGAWTTVSNRFRQWRDAKVFEAVLAGLIGEAGRCGEVDLSLVSVDSTTARAHHDAAGMHLPAEVMTALEEAAAAKEAPAPEKGAVSRDKTGRTTPPPAKGTLPATRNRSAAGRSAAGGGSG